MYPDHNPYYSNQYFSAPCGYTIPTYVPSNPPQVNRIYVNKNFVQPPSNNTVLVNPNFNRQVHVNPNFNKTSKTVKSQGNTVFVNPNILSKMKSSQNATISSTKSNTTVPTNGNVLKSQLKSENNTSSFVPARPPLVTKYSKINNSTSMGNKSSSMGIANRLNSATAVKSSYSINNLLKAPVPVNNAIVKTKTKLIRVQPQIPTEITHHIQGSMSIKRIETAQKSYKPKQMVSRHKLIRNNSPQKANSFKGIVKTKYKLIRSNGSPKMKTRQLIKRVSISLANTPNKYKLDNRTRRQSCTLIKSRYKLTKKAFMMRLDPQNSIIKSTKFRLIRSTKQKILLRTIPSRMKKTSAPNKKKKFTKRNLVKINKKKLQKNNIPCEIYNKRGKCKGLANGKCLKKHDPNQIQICIWFLQGICRDEKCSLSHKVSPEKMPTCKFYLEGICLKDNCPYLHVKLSKDAPVCRDFLNGYCVKALECDKRHQFLCPDFERDGKCPKQLCRYPHGKAVRQYRDTLLNVIARTRKSKVQSNARKGKPQAPKALAEEKTEKGESDVNAGCDSKRYYECPSGVDNGEEKEVSAGEVEEVASIFDRPKLGALPSFISL